MQESFTERLAREMREQAAIIQLEADAAVSNAKRGKLEADAKATAIKRAALALDGKRKPGRPRKDGS